eukprot:scaffold24327_cov21-Tisochrysis_lutea.AAC.1
MKFGRKLDKVASETLLAQMYFPWLQGPGNETAHREHLACANGQGPGDVTARSEGRQAGSAPSTTAEQQQQQQRAGARLKVRVGVEISGTL